MGEVDPADSDPCFIRVPSVATFFFAMRLSRPVLLFVEIPRTPAKNSDHRRRITKSTKDENTKRRGDCSLNSIPDACRAPSVFVFSSFVFS